MMPTTENPYFNGGGYSVDPAWGSIGSSLTKALFGDPAAAQAQAESKSLIAQRAAEAGYATSQTATEDQKRNGALALAARQRAGNMYTLPTVSAPPAVDPNAPTFSTLAPPVANPQVAPAVQVQPTSLAASIVPPAAGSAPVVVSPLSAPPSSLAGAIGSTAGPVASTRGAPRSLSPLVIPAPAASAPVAAPPTTLADAIAQAVARPATAAPAAPVLHATPTVLASSVRDLIASLVPGVVMTSGARTPEHNAAVGGVPNSDHLTTNGGRAEDIAPIPGMTFAQWEAALIAKGVNVKQAIDETHTPGHGSHWHVAWYPDGTKNKHATVAVPQPGPALASVPSGVANVPAQAPLLPEAPSPAVNADYLNNYQADQILAGISGNEGLEAQAALLGGDAGGRAALIMHGTQPTDQFAGDRNTAQNIASTKAQSGLVQAVIPANIRASTDLTQTGIQQAGDDRRAALGQAGEDRRNAARLAAGAGPDGTGTSLNADGIEFAAQYGLAHGGAVPPGYGRSKANVAAIGNQMAADAAKAGKTVGDYIQGGQDLKGGQATVTAFDKGKQGDGVRSIGVAMDHLDQLKAAMGALDSGNVPLFNSISQKYQKATGSAIPTNVAAVHRYVSDEVTKAILGSGGTGGDRDAAMQTIPTAGSPAQMAGGISAVQGLMAGQLSGYHRQYAASTGRSDFGKYLSPASAALLAAHEGTGAMKAATVRVANDAQYAAIPSGRNTPYIGPDGQLRRKP